MKFQRKEPLPIGFRSHKWIVISEPFKSGKRLIWHVQCRCACGTVKNVQLTTIRNFGSKSCGCIRKKHGLNHEKLNRVWFGMISRCYNTSNKAYKNYGGRGISVSKQWRDDYLKFRSFALNNGYREGLEIDRINNNKGYFPSNVRFVEKRINARNKRVTKYLEAFGEKKSLIEWSEDSRCVVSKRVLISRIYNHGWNHHKAITTKKIKAY